LFIAAMKVGSEWLTAVAAGLREIDLLMAMRTRYLFSHSLLSII
jgi:hypothetical protein